ESKVFTPGTGDDFLLQWNEPSVELSVNVCGVVLDYDGDNRADWDMLRCDGSGAVSLYQGA
ncbi:MAG: hypothetical protein IJU65_00255, partial [Desulfovibrio sp.]|nr:hypothetical protein [Desulfovibrio sp.]